MSYQATIYCGKRHRRSDGVPVDHRCRVLNPAFLEAERLEEHGRAVDVLEATPIILHDGIASDPE